MQDQARIVIIGGVVVGASLFYHLSKLGCTDTVVEERSQITSGSTWLAADGKMRFCNFKIDTEDLDAIGDEPVAYNCNVEGWITSGGYSTNFGRSMDQGYFPKNLVDQDNGWIVELLGQIFEARPQKAPLLDPNRNSMRS